MPIENMGSAGISKKVDLFTDRVRGGKGYLYSHNAITGETVELPTLTCAHCNRVVVLNPARQRQRGYCRKCNAYVCDYKVCSTECHPFQESLELAVQHNRDDLAATWWLPRGKNGELFYQEEQHVPMKSYPTKEG